MAEEYGAVRVPALELGLEQLRTLREIGVAGQVCNLSGQDKIVSHGPTVISRTVLTQPRLRPILRNGESRGNEVEIAVNSGLPGR